MIVAPNSPSERAKPNTAPAMTPENESGRLSVKKTLSGLAPNVLAACSSLGSIASKACLIERTISGNAITAEANTAPRQEKLKEKPNHSHKYCPIAPRFAITISKR